MRYITDGDGTKKIYKITFQSTHHPHLMFKSFPTDVDKYIESATNSKGYYIFIDNIKCIPDT